MNDGSCKLSSLVQQRPGSSVFQGGEREGSVFPAPHLFLSPSSCMKSGRVTGSSTSTSPSTWSGKRGCREQARLSKCPCASRPPAVPGSLLELEELAQGSQGLPAGLAAWPSLGCTVFKFTAGWVCPLHHLPLNSQSSLTQRGDWWGFLLCCVERKERAAPQFVRIATSGSSHRGSATTNLTRIPEDVGWIPGLAQWVLP